jgi:hypothetical protein
MLNTGTFSAPLLCSQVPAGKSILHPHIACQVTDTSTANHYSLYAHTCADGCPQQDFFDFIDSYSPVASIESIRVLLNIAASTGLLVSNLDTVAYLNTKFMIVDCITKPFNGAQLHIQIAICIGEGFYPPSSTIC